MNLANEAINRAMAMSTGPRLVARNKATAQLTVHARDPHAVGRPCMHKCYTNGNTEQVIVHLLNDPSVVAFSVSKPTRARSFSSSV